MSIKRHTVRQLWVRLNAIRDDEVRRGLPKSPFRFTATWYVTKPGRYRGRITLWDLHQVWICCHTHANREQAQTCADAGLVSILRQLPQEDAHRNMLRGW